MSLRGVGLVLALLTSSSAQAAPVILPATSPPDAWNWRPFVVGFGVGGLVGAAAGGAGGFAVSSAVVAESTRRANCDVNDCEGQGLLAVVGVPSATLLGAAAGGAVGAFGGGAIAMALTE